MIRPRIGSHSWQVIDSASTPCAGFDFVDKLGADYLLAAAQRVVLA